MVTQREIKLLALLAAFIVVAIWLKRRESVAGADTTTDVIARNAAAWSVPESWIRAIIQTESGGDAYAYRAEPQISDASYGLMQLLYSTARGLGYSGQPDGLYDPETNVYYGTKLLSQLRGKYGADPSRVYSAYNSGSPDKYRTSSQVAANVNRFIVNLGEV